MKEYLISQYIDNELDLDEKITFVEVVHHDQQFTKDAVAMLQQEKLLRGELVAVVPIPAMPPTHMTVPTRSFFSIPWFRPLVGIAVATLFVALISVFRPETPLAPQEEQLRFVIYLPDSSQTRIVGTFTGWKPVNMDRVGEGYWTVTLPVPKGEHRYSYLVENGKQIADPTIVAREQDDFGGENSVIKVQVTI